MDLDILSQARNNQEVKVTLMLDPKLRVLKDKLSIVNLVSDTVYWQAKKLSKIKFDTQWIFLKVHRISDFYFDGQLSKQEFDT